MNDHVNMSITAFNLEILLQMLLHLN